MAIIRIQGEEERRRGVVYQLDSTIPPIGEGGMGKVYKGVCIDERTGATRPIAIKCMFNDLPANAYERARREAEIQLRNDNLIEMLGFVETSEMSAGGMVEKHYHVISELLTGVSLSDILEGKTKDRDGQDVPFAIKMMQDFKNDPEHFARIIVINILSGLMALHDAGYIHRDIDPSNIMLTAEGRIKLIDFGIAKQMNNLTTGDKALTVAGKFMGKPEYAAPELALGDISHQNQTTDIYAVGILLYQCIMGHTPFEGARHEILEKQLKNKIPLEKIKNKALRRIIATACEKKQELRYQTSAQMRVALENMDGAKPAMSPKKKYSIIAAVAAAVMVLGAVLIIIKNKQEKAQEQIELAHIEQTKQAEKQLRSTISDNIADVDILIKKARERTNEDSYENDFISAFQLLMTTEEIISKNNVADIDVTLIDSKKSAILSELDSIAADLLNNAALLSELGEESVAQHEQERAESIRQFVQQARQQITTSHKTSTQEDSITPRKEEF